MPLWSAARDIKAAQPGAFTRPGHLQLALTFDGFCETGENRGAQVDTWNRFAGNPVGSSYCAAFVSWCLHSGHATFPQKKTGWAKGFIFPGRSISAAAVARKSSQVKPGDIVIWTRPGGGGHIGFVVSWDGTTGETIEANTSNGLSGSQYNGGGVYRRVRRIEPYNRFRIIYFTPVET